MEDPCDRCDGEGKDCLNCSAVREWLEAKKHKCENCEGFAFHLAEERIIGLETELEITKKEEWHYFIKLQQSYKVREEVEDKLLQANIKIERMMCCENCDYVRFPNTRKPCTTCKRNEDSDSKDSDNWKLLKINLA